MALQLNPKQIETLKAYREEWAEAQAEIERQKENQKQSLEALFDSIGLGKDNKDEKKAIKAGFRLYYKENAKETQELTDEAVTVAEL